MNIKEEIQKSNFKQWQIAEKLCINEFMFSRMLRHPEEIKSELKDKIYLAIKELKAENKEVNF